MDQRNHKWVRDEARVALDEVAFHMESVAFHTTRRKHRFGFATAEHALLTLLGLVPASGKPRDADNAEYLLRVLDDKAPDVAALLRQLARERYLQATPAARENA